MNVISQTRMWFYVCVCPEIKLIKCIYLMKQSFVIFKSFIKVSQIIYLGPLGSRFDSLTSGFEKKSQRIYFWHHVSREVHQNFEGGVCFQTTPSPSSLCSAHVCIHQGTQSLTECGQHGAMGEVSGAAQGSRKGRPCITA